MSVVKVHVENKVYTVFNDRLKKNLGGSRLCIAVNSDCDDPKIAVVHDYPNRVTDVYLDITLTAWKRVWNMINSDRRIYDDEDFKYFSEDTVNNRVKVEPTKNKDDESNYVELSNELLARFKDEGEDTDDYEGYHVDNLEDLIKISKPSPDLIEEEQEEQDAPQHLRDVLGSDIENLIKTFQTKMSQDGSVSSDVINDLSSNPELNQLLKTQQELLEEDSPTDSLDLDLDQEEEASTLQ